MDPAAHVADFPAPAGLWAMGLNATEINQMRKPDCRPPGKDGVQWDCRPRQGNHPFMLSRPIYGMMPGNLYPVVKLGLAALRLTAGAP